MLEFSKSEESVLLLYAQKKAGKLLFYLNVKMRCLLQRVILHIIVSETKKKEVIPDAK